ncbi:MAG: NADH-quinone oxidoreductase subunit H [Chloroflexi bacterium]|nr:NADH-quinone oxidoreductase subunit H [Chloroflexota bacterium]
MDTIRDLVTLFFFPGGLFVLALGMSYEWVDRKLMARVQNRVGPRWFQPFADIAKLLTKEEVIPLDGNGLLFLGLPIVALAGALTSALYVPVAGWHPAYSFQGDLIVALYLLSLLTLCTGLAGANTSDHFSLVGATRTLTQLFSYEAPFLLAMLGPAVMAHTWQINEIIADADGRWMLFLQPIGFIVALIGLLGKLEMSPFNAPEAETEIVAGALTEYSGRGLALFRLGRHVELVIGLTMVAAFYMGGVNGLPMFVLKTLILLLGLVGIQSLVARLRIDQTVGLWWRWGSLLVLAQWLVLVVWEGVQA